LELGVQGDLVNQDSASISKELERQVQNFCKHIAGACNIEAVGLSENYTVETPSPKSTLEVILVLHNFQPRLMSYVRVIDGRNVVFLVVDKWIFERDVDRGFLGEALARLLIFPYTALVGGDYLHAQEIELKNRLIVELLENIVLGYPEFSYSMRIKPEYFMYEVMLNRVRVFPPMAYGAAPFLHREANKERVEAVLSGYSEALKQLEKNGVVSVSNDYITITNKFITAKRHPAMRFANQIKNAPRAIFTSFFGVFPQFLNFISQNADAFFRFQNTPKKREARFSTNFIDPQEFVLVPTAEGYVSLADKLDIRGFAKRVLRLTDSGKIKVEEFGSYLNDIYLLKADINNKETRILVKRFRDLTSFKWFPLSMWSIGTTTFALLGRSRLERECAINKVLAEAGFCVPKLLHVSANERLVFMEYIEGENLSNAIKRIAAASSVEKAESELALVSQVGETYAKVHALNVVLGDTKPENVMVTAKGELCLLDFEQASRKGERAWDVACFLYYSGHYLPLSSELKAEALTKAFISGYLKAGGNILVVKCAGSPRYTRVFSIFTLPSILRVMAGTCAKTESQK